MAKVVPKTIGESLYWSYAQMAMAFASSRHGKPTYQQSDFIVRGNIYYGLLSGRLNLGSFFRDEQEKITGGSFCSYCGGADHLSLDHLIPQLRGGEDDASNLVTACRSCNSSKGAKDLLEWATSRGELPTLVLLRRYLKLAIGHCVRNDLMSVPLADSATLDPPLPFALASGPHTLPEPALLVARLFPGDE